MATILTSSIVNVNLVKLKRDLEDLGDIKVISIRPKAGINPTSVTLKRLNGADLTGGQIISAQALIDAHVDAQLENVKILGNSEFILGTLSPTGEVIIKKDSVSIWKIDSANNLIPLQSGQNIGDGSNRVNSFHAVSGNFSGNLQISGDLNVDGIITGSVSVAVDFVDEEEPSGLVDGINTVYNTSFDFVPSSLKVFINGSKLTSGISNDFTVTDNDEFTLNFAPSSGDIIRIDYRKT